MSTTNKTINTTNPTTGKALKTYDFMTDAEAEKAVEQCHEAFTKWKLITPEERAKKIKSIGESLSKHSDELVKLMTQEMGKLLKQGEHEI
ncbi:MAG TPA: aldehyde dehydrogenase family protein [Leeuwenhoekiella sp.]|nr:aldehyde dehydrogenase family protein [Leeuwenhoekiella sp.]